MDGFYITVKNGLLDPKHVRAMEADKGSGAVWLFLWLLDKMTVIDHDKGEGKVLGGKPIKFEDIQNDLLISRATYKRWLGLLRNGGYIHTLRTPYGLVITVYKAFKVFGQKVEKSDGASVSHHTPKPRAITPPSQEPSNKTIQLDKTVRQKDLAAHAAKFTTLGADVIKEFEAVDPKNKTYYANKTQRTAADFLIAEYGFEEVKKVISWLPRANKIPYFPTITTPAQLRDKWVPLHDAIQRERGKQLSKTKKTVIV